MIDDDYGDDQFIQGGFLKTPPPQCIRIGVQEDNFVFDHILHFSQEFS